jgi:plastocyanin
MTPTDTTASTRRPGRGRTLAHLLGILLTAVAALLGSAPAAHAADHAVVIEHYAYSPASLTIDAGDTVTWTNRDTVAHDVSVMSGPQTFHSPMLAQGQSWSHTFSAAGSYSYMCSVHPDMVASVTVRAAAPQPTPTKHASPAPVTQTTTHSSHAAPATTPVTTPVTTPAPATGTHAAAPRHRKAGATAAAAAPTTSAVEPVTSAEVSAPLAQDGATLDPLLLVAGVSAAVMVFCLLLMTSRPVAKPGAPATAETDAA